MSIEEAAEKYAKEFWSDCNLMAKRICFIRGAESDAAKEYWYEQFKAQEQGYSLEYTFKQIDEEAERLYPYQKATVFNSGEIGRRQKNKVDADRMKFKSAAIFGYKLLPKPTAHEQKQVPTDEEIRMIVLEKLVLNDVNIIDFKNDISYEHARIYEAAKKAGIEIFKSALQLTNK